ncbi:FecR family protein [Roseibium sp. SCPC15]|uniref:FecR family protein n=1 Tax=Roseibium sp. SCP15 TaxID=3141376 RepID=UPI00333BE835
MNAAEQAWVVKRVSGIVYFVAPNVEAFRVKRGMVFEKGYTLGTRAGARALIARGNETISVGPNTTFAISKYRSQGVQTTLLQRKGTIEVDVQKRGKPHFTVETPFFAAVVKGTRFEVSVRGKKANVSVQRGLVEVEDFASGDRADLGAGQSASSEPARNVGLKVAGRTKPSVKKGTKRAPAFDTPPVKNVPSAAEAAGRGNSQNVLGSIFGGNGNGNSGNGNSGNGNGNSGNGNSGNGNGNSGNGNSGNGNGNSGNGNSGNGNGNSGNGNSGNGNGNSGNGNSGNGNGNSGNGNSGNGNGNSGNGNSGNGNGNSGNGNSGNGNGNSGNGNSGNGNGNSGNGNSGNGNGNSGNGNSGNGNGNGKK